MMPVKKKEVQKKGVKQVAKKSTAKPLPVKPKERTNLQMMYGDNDTWIDVSKKKKK